MNESNREKIVIATHSGHFHADEILAVATLKIALANKDIEIVRTRDMDKIKSANYVLDVGGIYDENINRFDHHQEGGAGKRENGIPYASFGLIWKHFGKILCGEEVSKLIDEKIVQQIDAIDNGVNISKKLFLSVSDYNIGDYFESFYPTWEEDSSETTVNIIFNKLVGQGIELINREISRNNSIYNARKIVMKSYSEATDKRLIILEKHYPAGDTLRQYPEPLFTVFKRDDGSWALSAIRKEKDFYENRKDLPEAWAGKTDTELEKISGVIGAKFCHRGRFIAVADSKEAILKMAEIALNS